MNRFAMWKIWQGETVESRREKKRKNVNEKKKQEIK